MKRVLHLVLATVLLFLLIQPICARADLIYMPMDDFVEQNQDDMDYENRFYRANGPQGSVKAYESPVSDRVLAEIENGVELHIYYLYRDENGIQWAFFEDFNGAGWVPADYLLLIYDYISFEEEHGNSFLEESGSLGNAVIGKTVYFWEYPWCEKHTYNVIDDSLIPGYTAVYVDSNGVRWGKTSYYSVYRNSWICLDHPTWDYETLVSNLDVAETVQETTHSATTEEVESNPQQEIRPQMPTYRKLVMAAAILCVLAVVAVTMLLLIKLRKRS